MPTATSLKEFLSDLMDAEHIPRPADEEWIDMIDRINTPGVVSVIDDEIYWYFLEVLPPKFMGGGIFAFAEGAEPLCIFWKKGDARFCRQLTWDETILFCSLAQIDMPS